MTTKAEAIQKVKELVSVVSADAILPESVLASSLDMSLIPDNANHYPQEPGYTPTYDVYYAAYLVGLYLESAPTLLSSSSENTSISVKPSDFKALRDFLSKFSPVLQNQSQLLQAVEIPSYRQTVKVSMTGDLSVDTDI